MIDRLCVIGVGLIGGSLARALRTRAAVNHIVGCGRTVGNLERARELGVIDSLTTNPAEAVRDADVVLIAVPLGAIRPVLGALQPALMDRTIITDAGSAKRCVLNDVEAVFGGSWANFVPGHPIAGTEDSGVDASFATLFEDHKVILTPVKQTDSNAVEVVRTMWQDAGASVVTMDPDHHDEVLAATSHLPHMLAYTLVDTLGTMEERGEIFRYAAGGFRDFTRIASSDPTMWHDICLANRDALLSVLAAFQSDLGRLTQAVEARDSELIRAIFTRAKSLRDAYSG